LDFDVRFDWIFSQELDTAPESRGGHVEENTRSFSFLGNVSFRQMLVTEENKK